jgi:hypothetical protein
VPDHMNVFEPYVSKAPHHEDALTRAFLLVLRGVPVAHAAWLALVDRAHRANQGDGVPPLHELGTPTVETQTATVPGVERVISLVQTDEAYFREVDATPSDRRQVLDGVVAYDDALAIVLENKPSHRDIREAQLDVSLPAGAALDRRVACVTWKEIVAAWAGLLEARHLSPAEVVLLGDFLDYVEDRFSSLRPYSKVALCGMDTERLQRRCRMVLQGVAGEGNVDYHRGWSWFIQLAEGQCATRVALMPKRSSKGFYLIVEIDPGDTTSQARTLYQRVSLPELHLLCSRGWTVEPNLHLAHTTRNLLWTQVTRPVKEYWLFWTEHADWLRQWKRPEFEKVFADLVDVGLAARGDRAEFERHIVNTKRSNFNMCPGLTLRWWLPLEDAAQLDQRDGLEAAIRGAIEDAAGVLKLRLPW